jgi:gliding motility-associated-like protein
MKTKIYLTVGFGIVIQAISYAQTTGSHQVDVAVPFNLSFWNSYSEKLHLTPIEKKEFISSQQMCHSHNHHSSNFKQVLQNQNPKPAGSCINIDFENGSLNGWLPSSGFHPLFNPLGCCPNAGGQQLITQVGATDPAGGFPMVAPGGSFSLRLGDNQIGGEADRIEQTFSVSAANANFTYKYAVVFQDPGHALTQQPAFQIEMRDSNNVQIPCTFYNVAAGANIPGFLNSINTPGVIYKPWTSVIVDLTNYIGQNVTIRFTTFDCALGGHFGYAYIDGICSSFVTGTSDTICVGATKNYCAPTGFGTYVWNGPGIINTNSQCINASAVGVYTCQTTLITGCTGPIFTYTLNHYPNPNVSFTNVNANACAQQFTFTNTSTILSGAITNYTWNFGSSTSAQVNPITSFPNYGNYSVSLNAISNNGCSSSITQTLVIYPNPIVNFSAPNTCQNNTVNFLNASSIASGSLSYNWNFGNSNTSTQVNPFLNYTNAGTYNVSLTAISNKGCSVTGINTLTIYPLPNVNFNSSAVCLGNTNVFNNLSNISSGSITNWVWDFDNNGIPNSSLQNPTFIYLNYGTYTVSLLAISNHNCINTLTNTINVYANPTASFATANVCFGSVSNFTNQSTIVAGNTIANYTWNFGNATQSSITNPQMSYATPGIYPVQLTAYSNNGCTNTYSSSLTIHYLPSVNFNSNSACKNQTTVFNNSTLINSGTIAKWRWDFENDGIWDDTLSVNPSKIYANSGNFACKLQAVSNFQCAAQKINSVIIHTNPIANFITKSTCLGDVSAFTNLSTSLDGTITSNQWDFNGDNVIDNVSVSPNLTYTANGVYMARLEVQTQYGCSNVITKSVYVNPKPQPVFTAQNKVGCANLCVPFSNASTISTGKIITTQWLFGDGSMPDYSQNPIHCYATGNYNVTLTLASDSGCISTLIKPNFVIVHPKPLAAFNVTPEEVDENDPQISVSSNATGALSTNYFINDGSSFSTQNFNHTLTNATTATPIIFQVVKNEFGCADTTSSIIKVKPSFVIYIPNTFTPNGDGVNDGFFAKGVGINKFTIQIYDRWGHLLFETNDIDDAWDGNTKGSSEPIKQDVYVWRAQVVDVFNKNHELTGHVNLIK